MKKKLRIADCGLRNEKEFGIRNSDCEITAQQCCALPFRNPQSAIRIHSIPQSAIRNPQSSRRGILLLVVLSMLTLFLLIGTAFIVSANHYRKTLKTFAKATEASNSTIDQGNLLDEVINQIVRDTNNQNSTLRFHSLLRDMYGNDGLMAEINDNSSNWAFAIGGPANPTGGQMIQFQLNLSTLTDQFGIPYASTAKQLSQINNAYNGLVLTFLDGLARGQSVRIVSYIPAILDTTGNITTPALFRVMAPRKADGSNIVAADFPDLNASRILINGRPFNGTGAGYDPTNIVANSARLSTFELVAGMNREVSLMPNASFFVYKQVDTNGPGTYGNYYSNQFGSLTPAQLTQLANGMGLVGQGGSDESYDVADFQNMMLAQLQTNPQETTIPDLDAANPQPSRTNLPGNLGQMVIPSLHRPALLNYWRRQLLNAGGDLLEDEPNLLRKVLLRPNWLDHPNFTGSNPDFATLGTNDNEGKLLRMIYGPWDVDNDNDGIRDSVWVDVGLPVMENADGRLVKPLAAILVLDMDGRLNINAHGSEDIANAANINFNETLASGTSSDNLPHGQGYGPAEISLEPLMGGSTQAQRWKWYKRFFQGAEADASFDALDASNDLIPIATLDTRKFRRRTAGKFGPRPNPANRASMPLPGIDNVNVFDLAAQLKMQGVPRWADGSILNTSSTANPILGGYASPPDYRGRYALGLNDFGQPVYESILDIGFAGTELDSNTPYELDLSLGAARGDSPTAPDGPYTMAELERILRAYDPDAGTLSSRIWKLAAEFKPNATATTPDLTALNLWRTTLTTDSYDLPVPSVVVPGWMILGKDKMANTKDDYVRRMGKPAVGATFADLIEYHLRDDDDLDIDTNVAAPTTAQLNTIRQRMAKLLPPDLADGLRLDINRPLGNGRDDNDNGVVDEPGENEGAFWASSATQLDAFTDDDDDSSDPYNFTGLFRDDVLFLRDLPKDFNGDNTENLQDLTDFRLARGIDGAIDTPQERVIAHNLRRQTLARDLYVLAMTLVDPLPQPFDPKDQQARARQLAQWAINVVDFRDPDNIMTAFEYDANPFDGWTVDADIASFDPTTMQPEWAGPDNKVATKDDTGGVVWGTERPEIIMTETLSWHDRATEDRGKGFEDAVTDENGDGKMDKDDEGEVGSQQSAANDTDFDQRKRPQGATFIELYNPWPANPAANADIRRVDNGVDLSAFNSVDGRSPVWRLLVNKCGSAFLYGGGPDHDYDDPDKRVRPQNPDRCVYFTDFDPGDASENTNWDDDGTAFFSSLAGTGIAGHGIVKPGGYCVIGSGEKTGGKYVASIGDKPRRSNAAANRAIVLDPQSTATESVMLRDGDGVSSLQDKDGFGVFAEPSNTSVMIIDRFFDKTRNMGMPRRFSVSEPANGYPDHVFNSVWKPATQEYKPILDIPLDNQRTKPGANVAGSIVDGQTIVGSTSARWFRGTNPNNLIEMRKDDENRLKLANKGSTVRTIPAFSWIYLQRLANPLQPWNPLPKKPNGTTNLAYKSGLPINPYLTIDSMGTNVTVFTGQARTEKRRQGGTVEDYNNADAMYSFSSVQRGRLNDADPEKLVARLGETQDDFRRMKISSAKVGFIAKPTKDGNSPQNLWGDERIGRLKGTGLPYGTWLNESGPQGDGLRHLVGTRSHYFNSAPDCTLGFMNEPFRGTGGTKNEPEQPFPWMTWNNRPFANGGELLQVPAFRSSQLAKTFSFKKTGTPPATNPRGDFTEQYSGEVRRGEYPIKTGFSQIYPELIVDGPFGHLLNFFRSEAGEGKDMMPNTADDEGIVGLHRLLDYIHVPSPFVKTETWLNPASFGSNLNVTSVDDPRYLRQPPFNRIAEYREPGRVNINTVVSGDVWDGGLLHRERFTPADPWDPLTNNYQEPNLTALPSVPGHSGPRFVENNVAGVRKDGVVESRRGYQGAVSPVIPGTLAPDDTMLLLDNGAPTFFGNPFRSSAAADLVPLPGMRQQLGVNCTTLRGALERRILKPLFAGETTDDSSTPLPDIENAFRDSDRNPYFRYQPISRLSSMTTTRSNVYAVWVTIGFFEVTEAPSLNNFATANGLNPADVPTQALYSKVYPEGYMLGKEAGSDTGDIRRVREFAMIDRTVPVAFEPGQNHNVDKAIRLRRRIE